MNKEGKFCPFQLFCKFGGLLSIPVLKLYGPATEIPAAAGLVSKSLTASLMSWTVSESSFVGKSFYLAVRIEKSMGVMC